MESLLQKCLFGHYEIFDTLKNLYLNKKFPCFSKESTNDIYFIIILNYFLILQNFGPIFA